MTAPQPVSIAVDGHQPISGLLQSPARPRACFVLAHGAGAGMAHPFLSAVSEGLLPHGIATLRYQFLYMERGSKRPDSPAVAQAAVRAAIGEAGRLLPGVGLIAGGKSFGGRMTSHAQAAGPLPGVRGLAFLGFPLHPAGKPSDERGKHLSDVRVPMLFLQGTRDALAEVELVEKLARRIGKLATLKLFADADHSFHVPARSRRSDEQVREELLRTIADWTDSLI